MKKSHVLQHMVSSRGLSLGVRVQEILDTSVGSPVFYSRIEVLLNELMRFDSNQIDKVTKYNIVAALQSQLFRLAISNSELHPSKRFFRLMTDDYDVPIFDRHLRLFFIMKAVQEDFEKMRNVEDSWFNIYVARVINGSAEFSFSFEEYSFIKNALSSGDDQIIRNTRSLINETLERFPFLSPQQYGDLMLYGDELHDIGTINLLVAMANLYPEMYMPPVHQVLFKLSKDKANPHLDQYVAHLLEAGDTTTISERLEHVKKSADEQETRELFETLYNPETLSPTVVEDIMIQYLNLILKTPTQENFESISWHEPGWADLVSPVYKSAIQKFFNDRLKMGDEDVIASYFNFAQTFQLNDVVAELFGRAEDSKSGVVKFDVFESINSLKLSSRNETLAIDYGLSLMSKVKDTVEMNHLLNLFMNQWELMQLSPSQKQEFLKISGDFRHAGGFDKQTSLAFMQFTKPEDE